MIDMIGNKHLGPILRRRLEDRHPNGTSLRRILAMLSDAQLVRLYLENDQDGKEHIAAKGTTVAANASMTVIG